MAQKNNSKINGFLKFRFSIKYRIKLYKKLKSFIEDGYPVYDSLQKFRNRFKKRKDFREKILDNWLNKMEKGNNLRNSMQGWVPDAELNLIASGEEGNGIELGLGEAIRFATSAAKIKATIIKGVTYPAVLFLVIIGFISLFSIQLAPTYLDILPLEKWPESASNLYYLSSFIVNYWYLFLAGLIGLGILISKTMGTWTGKIREKFDKIPPWSVYKVYQACAFLISLSSMMQSGVPLNDALLKLKKTGSKWLVVYIDKMLKNLVKGGRNAGEHLNVGLLDEETADDVIDYTDLGSFEKSIYSIGEQNLIESIEAIESRMGIIKNVMLILVGVCVMWIYASSIFLNTAAADSVAYQR